MKLALALIPLLLAACTTPVGPSYRPITAPVPPAWNEDADESVIAAPSVASRWWTHFGDPTLESLIHKAMTCNFDLREAYARIREARAARFGARAGHFPNANVAGSYTRSGSSTNSTGLDAADRDTFNLGVDAAWELDLFGRVRRSTEAARADYQAAVADSQAIRVSLAADVALAYLDIRTFQQRLLIAQTNITSQERSLTLATERHEEGDVSTLDPAQAESVLASTQAQVPTLYAGLAQARNRLALLLGTTAGMLDPALKQTAAIPNAPQQILIGVPADLVRRRPDIRVAERNMAAQTARIGIATADLYPTLSLSGQLGYEAQDAGDLLGSASRFFGIGPAIRWNVFDGGAIRSNIAVQRARTCQTALRYEKTVLAALREVEDALAAYRNEKVRRAALQRAQSAGRRTMELALERYREGESDFQQVLDAQRSQFDFDDRLIVSEANVTAGMINIYKALGGGWQAPGDAAR